jgi:hypothetical protein
VSSSSGLIAAGGKERFGIVDAGAGLEQRRLDRALAYCARCLAAQLGSGAEQPQRAFRAPLAHRHNGQALERADEVLALADRARQLQPFAKPAPCKERVAFVEGRVSKADEHVGGLHRCAHLTKDQQGLLVLSARIRRCQPGPRQARQSIQRQRDANLKVQCARLSQALRVDRPGLVELSCLVDRRRQIVQVHHGVHSVGLFPRDAHGRGGVPTRGRKIAVAHADDGARGMAVGRGRAGVQI